TRFSRDWSSDVCSSDLIKACSLSAIGFYFYPIGFKGRLINIRNQLSHSLFGIMAITAQDVNKLRQLTGAGMMDCKKALTEAEGRSEERRVGKECRSGEW